MFNILSGKYKLPVVDTNGVSIRTAVACRLVANFISLEITLSLTPIAPPFLDVTLDV